MKLTIRSCTAHLKNVHCITGFDFVPHDKNLFADLVQHPNDAGFRYYFQALLAEIRKIL